ncbi:hypothetical protein RB620_28660, partial [Paenibacillus sp. LHD-117]|uniref:hypothetical protein n=1 Tax=Paenibacillus sp. LHD-117 TaxID=3071412 RepID=UPI0027DFC28D
VFFAIIGVISKSQGVFRFLAYISMTINRFPSLGMNCISHELDAYLETQDSIELIGYDFHEPHLNGKE